MKVVVSSFLSVSNPIGIAIGIDIGRMPISVHTGFDILLTIHITVDLLIPSQGIKNRVEESTGETWLNICRGGKEDWGRIEVTRDLRHYWTNGVGDSVQWVGCRSVIVESLDQLKPYVEKIHRGERAVVHVGALGRGR